MSTTYNDFIEINKENLTSQQLLDLTSVEIYNITLNKFPQHKNNPEFIFYAAKHDPKNLQFANPKVINNKSFFLELIPFQPSSILYAPEDIKNDIDFFLTHIATYPTIYPYIKEELKLNKELTILAVENRKENTKHVPGNIIHDRDVAFAAIKSNPKLLASKYKRYKNDFDFITNLMENQLGYFVNNNYFQFLGSKLKSNLNFAKFTFSKPATGSYFNLFSQEIRNNKEILMLALKSSGEPLRFTSDENKNATEVINYALSNFGWSISYLSDENKSNFDYALKAVKHTGVAFQYLNDDLKNNKTIAMEAIKSEPHAIMWASDELKNDKELALIACSKMPSAYKYLSPSLVNQINEFYKKNYSFYYTQPDTYNHQQPDPPVAEILESLIKEEKYNQVKNQIDNKNKKENNSHSLIPKTQENRPKNKI